MRVLIVDDEPNARRRLQIMLEELDVEVVGEAANGVEALEKVEALTPDVVLLDIQMPEVDGFDVVRHLPADGPMVVFQTAHDEFALKAFEHAAVDYLVKPVSLDRLRESLERVRGRGSASDSSGMAPQLMAALRAAVGADSVAAPRRLLVREGRGHRLLPIRQIRSFVARDGEVYACSGEREFLADYTLAELEARLTAAFVRANRAELVRVAAIEKWLPESDGAARLVLSDGSSVRVSRRRASAVRARLEAEA